ncbi:MAG: protease inhibitor I42 family protein [Ginsengibacter sp.]
METRKLKNNDSFEVTLKGRGAAGYEWQYEIFPKDIVSVERSTQPLKNNISPMPSGWSSDEMFTVTALKKGTATLHFYLVRTWEVDSVLPKDEKRINVIVE